MLRSLLLVGAGGAVGSMARYGIGHMVSKYVDNPFPIGTFAINVLGSLIIGILFGLTARNQWLQEWGILLLASGFCGGFTTFSTFALDNINLMQKGQSVMAIIYMGLSVIIGLLLCKLGIWLAGS
jgi:fluoride exporter